MTKKELKEVMQLASSKNVEVIPIRYSYFGHKLNIVGVDYSEKEQALKALNSARIIIGN